MLIDFIILCHTLLYSVNILLKVKNYNPIICVFESVPRLRQIFDFIAMLDVYNSIKILLRLPELQHIINQYSKSSKNKIKVYFTTINIYNELKHYNNFYIIFMSSINKINTEIDPVVKCTQITPIILPILPTFTQYKIFQFLNKSQNQLQSNEVYVPLTHQTLFSYEDINNSKVLNHKPHKSYIKTEREVDIENEK